MVATTTPAFGLSGRIVGSYNKLMYPSPFFDVASHYMPRNTKELFRWCEHYFVTHPVIHQCISKMAEYPITELVVEDDDPKLARKWEELFNDHLDYKGFLVNVGLDYYTFGNAYISPFFPFVKMLKCRQCNESFAADTIIDKWDFSNYTFTLTCPKCKHRGTAEVEDTFPKNIEKLRLVRWSPHNVLVNGTEFGSYYYFYKIPQTLANDWVMGQKYKVVGTPQKFLQASKENKLIIMNSDNMYHLKRSSISGDSCYGVPLQMPILKDAFLFQIFKKSLEAILLEHAVPLRVIFPQAASAAADVSAITKLSKWKAQVEDNLIRWRMDPNYISVLPYPLGQETVGGDAKVFLFSQEIMTQADILVTGMGVPREFITGGISWSGSNISLKMLENTFINYRLLQKKLTKFLMKSIGNYMSWPLPKDISFKNFKMADDLQRKMLFLQLNQMQKISDTTLLSECELDSEKEDSLTREEMKRRKDTLEDQQIAAAEVQAKAQSIIQKQMNEDQMEAQKQMQELGSPVNDQQQAGVDIMQQAQMIAQKLFEMPESQGSQYLQQLSAQYPQMGSAVQEIVNRMQATGQGSSVMQQEPAQKPPRRFSQ